MTLSGPATAPETSLPSTGDEEVAIDCEDKVRFDISFFGLSAFWVPCTGFFRHGFGQTRPAGIVDYYVGGFQDSNSCCSANSSSSNQPVRLALRGV